MSEVMSESMHTTRAELAKDVPLHEGAALDARDWDSWLDMYTPDCVYWVPTWIRDDELSSNPKRELAHMYYSNRSGLEDRILRIRSRRSPASQTTRRTTHMLGGVILDSIDERQAQLRTSWTCHIFLPQYKKTQMLFGRAEYELRWNGDEWKIASKKTIVQNDFLPSVVDVYCL